MIAYHGTWKPERDLAYGLELQVYENGCQIGHVCLADRAELAACFGTVLEVDLEGLDLPEEGFVAGEMRIHERIDRSRLRLLAQQPAADDTGWEDPAFTPTEQHPTCMRLR